MSTPQSSLIDKLLREKENRPAKDYVSTVKDWYKSQFNKDLPLANIGLSDFHRSKGWEHSRAFDVSLHPDSESGKRLISYLQSQGIPYIAQTGAVSKGGRTISTGPHIHVGPPSSSMSKRSLVDRLVEQKSSGTTAPTTDTLPATVLEQRRKLFGEPLSKERQDIVRRAVTGGASGQQQPKLDHPYNASRILTEATNSPEAARRAALRQQIREQQQPMALGPATGVVDTVLHPVTAVRKIFDPEGVIDQEVEERIAAERRQSSPEVTAIRKEYGAMGTLPTPMGQGIQTRSVAQPLARAGGGILKLAGGAASLAGLTPNKFSEWANERGRIVEEAASLPPLDERGEEIVQKLPEKVTTAIADTGLSIAQIILLKRATGLPFGRLMGLEAALRTSDMPLDKRTQEVAKAAVLGKVLERHMSRKLSAAAFAGPTAVETGAAVSRGQMSLEDAILQTAVSGGTGFALGGGKKSLVDRLVAEKETRTSEKTTTAGSRIAYEGDVNGKQIKGKGVLLSESDPYLKEVGIVPDSNLRYVRRDDGGVVVLKPEWIKPALSPLAAALKKKGYTDEQIKAIESGQPVPDYAQRDVDQIKSSAADNDPLVTVYRGGELIPGKPQDYTTTREKAEKYAWNGIVSEIRVPKSMLDRYRVSEFRHDDYFLITPPKGERVIRSDVAEPVAKSADFDTYRDRAVERLTKQREAEIAAETKSDATEPTPALRQQATSATEVPRAAETVTEPTAAVSPPSLTIPSASEITSKQWFRGHKAGEPLGQTETFIASSPEQSRPFAFQVGGEVSEVRFKHEPRVYESAIPWNEYQRHWKNSALLRGYDVVPIVEPNGQSISLAVRNRNILEIRPRSDSQLAVPPSTTSARKATMAEDRVELDLPELPAAERKSWQVTLDNAKSRGLDREATNLADEVLRKPRVLDDEQTAGIVLRAQQVKNEHAAAMEKVRSSSGAELEAATDRLKSLEHEFDRLTTAAKKSGSEKGRALASQKLTINQDYDLVSVLTRAKAAKGAELTPKERVEYTELQQKYAAVLEKLSGVERKVATDALQKDINRIAKTQQRTETKELLDAEFAVLQTQFKQARKETSGVQASGLAGIDPEGKLTALILKMAQNRIKAGVTKAEQLVDDIYNAIKDSAAGVTVDDVREVLRGGLPSPRVARLEKQIDEMEAGTWKPTTREKREPTDEEFRLMRRRDDLKRHIEAKLRHDAMSGGERFLREIGNALGLYRSTMTAIDASFGLRQGKIGLARKPALWADAWKKQWAGVDNKKYDRAVWRIENDPDFPLMDRFGLETPSVAMKHSFSLTAKNEDFPSEWTQRIPVLRQSEQVFNLMGDVLRTSWFKSDLKMLQKAGFDPNNPAHADVFRKSAEDINTYTGRTNLQQLIPGKVGKSLHQATPVLNQLTFAIRWWASRLKVLTLPLDPRMYPQIPRTMKLYKSMPRAQRVEAWKTLFAFYGLVSTQLAAARLAGAEIDVDPDSPDFLKARFAGVSDRHFDVSAGMANHLRFAARMAKRIYEAKTGNPRKGFGNAPGEVVGSYLRSKESPPVSIAHDIFFSRQTKEGYGTDFKGDPVYPTGKPGTGVVGRLKSARLLPKPIVMSDAMEAYDEMGWTGVATTLPFTFLGESVSVYKGKKKSK